nr:hypothetical protein [Tanacetum cinerariifolium]
RWLADGDVSYGGVAGCGGDEVAVAVVVVLEAGAARGGEWVVDLIDPVTGSIFGVRQKCSPEKFPGGGGGGGRWPTVGCRKYGRGDCVCFCVINEMNV